eukprot:COSAG01_NODE_1472_length_10197_cov_4.374431_8_plen_56_part_00
MPSRRGAILGSLCPLARQMAYLLIDGNAIGAAGAQGQSFHLVLTMILKSAETPSY